MGLARSDEKAQRAYLGKIATNFERTVGYSLNAYYTQDPMFTDRLEMRLITRIIELNEVFSAVFSSRGHTRRFEPCDETEKKDKSANLQTTNLGFELPEAPPELADIIITDRFECPEPSEDSIMQLIEKEFRQSRGPELGTVSLHTLAIPWPRNLCPADIFPVWWFSTRHYLQRTIQALGGHRPLTRERCHHTRPSVHTRLA